MRVHCPACHRVEHWADSDHQVEIEGGSRRPAEHPLLAAWNTCRAARADGKVVVGPCPCGQPLLADTGSWHPWVLDTDDGTFTVRAVGQSGPDGDLDEATLHARLRDRYRERFEVRPFQWLFQGTVMLSIVGPAILWIMAVCIVIIILTGLLQRPGF